MQKILFITEVLRIRLFRSLFLFGLVVSSFTIRAAGSGADAISYRLTK